MTQPLSRSGRALACQEDEKERLFSDTDIEQSVGKIEEAGTPVGQGLRGFERVSLDIDEPVAVSKGGAWDDPANKRFLERTTNQLTKNALTEVAPSPAGRTISLSAAKAEGPAAFRTAAEEMLTRNFSEITELADVTNEARAAMRNLNRSVRDLTDALNESIRGRIAAGRSPSAKLVNEALRTVGVDPETLSTGATLAGSGTGRPTGEWSTAGERTTNEPPKTAEDEGAPGPGEEVGEEAFASSADVSEAGIADAAEGGIGLRGLGGAVAVTALMVVLGYFAGKEEKEELKQAWRDLAPEINAAVGGLGGERAKLIRQTKGGQIIYANISVDLITFLDEQLEADTETFHKLEFNAVKLSTQRIESKGPVEREEVGLFGGDYLVHHHDIVSVPIYDPEVELFKDYVRWQKTHPGVAFPATAPGQQPARLTPFPSPNR